MQLYPDPLPRLLPPTLPGGRPGVQAPPSAWVPGGRQGLGPVLVRHPAALALAGRELSRSGRAAPDMPLPLGYSRTGVSRMTRAGALLGRGDLQPRGPDRGVAVAGPGPAGLARAPAIARDRRRRQQRPASERGGRGPCWAGPKERGVNGLNQAIYQY